ATHGGAERDRPPPAHTGGFGEPLCTACHFQADANTGTGSIIVTGVPAAYTPDSTYTLAISVVQAYLMAGGFQMSARLADGTQAGSLAPAPDDRARAAVTVHDGVQYMHHLYDGTSAVASDT